MRWYLKKLQVVETKKMLKERKILIVSDRYYPFIGGVEKIVQGVAEELIKNNINVVVLTRQPSRDVATYEVVNGVPVYRVKTHFFNWYHIKKKQLRKHIADSNKMVKRTTWQILLLFFHIIFTPLKKATILSSLYFISQFLSLSKRCNVVHIERTNVFVTIFIFLSNVLNKKVVVTFHSYVPSEFDLFKKKAIMNWAINNFLRKRVIFIAVSNYLRKILIEDLYFDQKKVFAIPNAIKLPPINKVEAARSRREDKVIFIGRLYNQEKDINSLIKAWRIVRRQDSNTKLHIIGDGPDYKELYNLSLDLNVQDSIVFIGEVKDVIAHIQSARIFCLPSQYEGLAISLLECMSWSLPCIVSNIPGNSELIKDGVNGLLFEVGNVNQLAEKILSLINNPNKAEEFGIKARQTIENNYDIRQSAKRHIEVYNSIRGNNENI